MISKVVESLGLKKKKTSKKTKIGKPFTKPKVVKLPPGKKTVDKYESDPWKKIRSWYEKRTFNTSIYELHMIDFQKKDKQLMWLAFHIYYAAKYNHPKRFCDLLALFPGNTILHLSNGFNLKKMGETKQIFHHLYDNKMWECFTPFQRFANHVQVILDDQQRTTLYYVAYAPEEHFNSLLHFCNRLTSSRLQEGIKYGIEFGNLSLISWFLQNPRMVDFTLVALNEAKWSDELREKLLTGSTVLAPLHIHRSRIRYKYSDLYKIRPNILRLQGRMVEELLIHPMNDPKDQKQMMRVILNSKIIPGHTRKKMVEFLITGYLERCDYTNLEKFGATIRLGPTSLTKYVNKMKIDPLLIQRFNEDHVFQQFNVTLKMDL